MVNNFTGDFIGFQSLLESTPHGAIHRIVGGCAGILNILWFFPLTDFTQRPPGELSLDRLQ